MLIYLLLYRAYLSSLQLESAMSFDDEDKVPQELIEKCAALSVRPTAIADLTSLINGDYI